MGTEKKEPSKTKVLTGEVRASYANVWVPQAIEGSADKKYSISLLIKKTDKVTIAAVKAAIEAAALEGVEKTWKGARPALAKFPKMNPLRDGDEEKPGDPVYAGHYFLNATSKTKPGIIGPDKTEIMNQEDFFSGCFCRASVNFFAFDQKGNKGVGVGLNNLMKTKDGERLGGKQSAEADFADVDAIAEDEDDVNA